MASGNGGDYYIGVIPRAPIASEDLINILVRKYRDYRHQALTEADGKAFGRTNLNAEKKRSDDSYHHELTNPTNFWFACFYAPAGLKGNVLRNAGEDPPALSRILQRPLNDDDQRILRGGDWVGMSSAHGPIPTSEWQLAGLQGGTKHPDTQESRFHLANLYFLQAHRGVKANDDEKLFLRLCHSSFEFLESLAYQRATIKPAYCRLRGTISPDAPGTKLMRIYESFTYHFIGWVPQVTAMILNGAKVEHWPEVEGNEAFYSHCIFPTFEKLCRIDENGVFVLKEESSRGEVWMRSRL